MKKISMNLFIESILQFIPLVLIIVLIVLELFKITLLSSLIEYFSISILNEETKLSMILTYNAVLVGFYVTIFSLFATSNLSSLKALIENDLDKKFTLYFITCASSALFAMISSIFNEVYQINLVSKLLFVMILIYSFIYCIRFIYVIISMFSYNLKSMRKIIDKKNEVRDNKYKEKQKKVLEELCSDIPTTNF